MADEEHAHDADDPQRCVECAASGITAEDAAAALRALRVELAADEPLTDADLIPLLGQLQQWLAQIIKHRVDQSDIDDVMAFIAKTPQSWAELAAHTLVPVVMTARAMNELVTAQDEVDPYAANTLGLTHMAAGVCAELMRVHAGRSRNDGEAVYRMAASLHGGLGAMIEHRLLTPPPPPLPDAPPATSLDLPHFRR